MELTHIFDSGAVVLDLASADRNHALLELLKALERQGRVEPRRRDEVLLGLLKREGSGEPGTGMGIAVPHIPTDAVKEMCGAIGISRDGIEYGRADAERVSIIFLVLRPPWVEKEHLLLLETLSRLIQSQEFIAGLREARRTDDVGRLLSQAVRYLGE